MKAGQNNKYDITKTQVCSEIYTYVVENIGA